MALQIYISIEHICADLKDQGWPTLFSWGYEMKPIWRFPKTAIWQPSTSRLAWSDCGSLQTDQHTPLPSVQISSSSPLKFPSSPSEYAIISCFFPASTVDPLWWLVQTYLPGAALRRQRSHCINQEWESSPSCMLHVLARLSMSITHSRHAFSGECVRSWLYEHSLYMYLTEIALSSHWYLDKLSSSFLCRSRLCCVRNILTGTLSYQENLCCPW